MKKLISVILTLALMFSFTACGDTQTKNVDIQSGDTDNYSDTSADNYQEDNISDQTNSNDDNVVVEYYDNGNKKRETYYVNGIVSEIYDYDIDEDIVSKMYCYESGKVHYRLLYDKNGNVICDTEYTEDGLVWFETAYEGDVMIYRQYYNNDPNGEIFKEDLSYPDGKFVTKTYSQDGKYVCTSEYLPGQQNTYEVYTDRQGNLVFEMLKDEENNVIESKSYYRNGLLENHYTNEFYKEYYDNGVLAVEVIYSDNGAGTVSQYDVEGTRYYYEEYNSKGDYIEQEYLGMNFTYETDQRYEDFDTEFSY